ncbi:sugar ABC transporter permease [Paenibacillus albiflavus]|uniref:Sugar ABC transporter permease n=1 Tax=Paenibacillus albiflavus TaxID=2545760 RepID=A0A4R4END6_9BACL|nr:sugar ABC transporter permease [Paenibacillus albiflavus]TCZ79935.1 sugar ABC transporter permease [Paenibacillus albiflavus]
MSETNPVLNEQKTSTKRPMLTEKVRSSLTAYLYISPFFVLFLVFGIYPIFYTFYLSFFKWNGLGAMKYVGFTNFELVLGDPLFWQSFWNTLIMGLLGTVPQLIIALLLAVALHSGIKRFRKTLRTIYFMPNITSIVAVTIVFSAIFSNKGMANAALGVFGIDPMAWDVDYWGVKLAIATMVLWRWTGYNAIIYFTGLQSIPNDLYEAAKIDGANKYQLLMHITIPNLRPFIIFTILISTIGSLQLFTEPYVFLGQGGSASTREEGLTMVIYMFSEAFRNGFFGTAAATSVILFVFTVIISLLNTLLSRKIGGAS